MSHKLLVFVGVLMVLQLSFCSKVKERHGRSTSQSAVDRGHGGKSSEIAAEETFDKICLKPSCIQAAAQVLKNMDTNADPCDDFYQFACGGFIKSSVIPEGYKSIDTFQVMSQTINELVRFSLETPSQPNLPKPFKLVKNLYKSCMNATERENKGLTPLVEILKKLGGMPVVEGKKWNGTGFEWITTIFEMHNMGLNINFLPYFNVQRNPDDDTQQIIHLSVDMNFLSLAVHGKMEKKYNVYNKMVEIAEMLNASREQAEDDFSKLCDFIIKIREIHFEDTGEDYRQMNVLELKEIYSSISWKEYFHRLIPSNIVVDDTEMIYVNRPEVIRRVLQLMDKTPKRVQANYIMWNIIVSSANFLNDEITDKYVDLMNVAGARVAKPSKRDFCLFITERDMPISLSALFVRDHFDKNSKKDISEVVENIRDQITNTTTNLRFDRKTKKIFLDKIASMNVNVAHSDELANDSILEKYYERLELSDDNLLGNVLNLTLFRFNNHFEKFRSEDIEKNWAFRRNPMTVSARNWYMQNIIDVSAGILQGPFNSIDSPKYMKYGGVGVTISHEINHGLGIHGNIDKDGNEIRQRKGPTATAIQKMFDCFIQQYKNYTVGDHKHINGERTLEENFADNGGVKIAYQAYVEWSTGREPESQLPSLPYTPRQMFWISYANTWCEKLVDPSNVDLQRKHSPKKFRVIGPLSNMKDFANDFKCVEGSNMNPTKKCDIW